VNSYKSEIHNDRWYIARRWLLSTFISATPLLIDAFFPHTILQNVSNWYWPIALASIMALFNICRPNRVNELTIDHSKKKVTFQYYDFNAGQEEISYPFENLRIKIKSYRSLWLSKRTHIYFLQGNKELFEISNYKDGFSGNTLKDLQLTLEDMTHPIEKKHGG
jgi:hypothetical protein